MNATQEEIFLIIKNAGVAADISKIKGETSLRSAGVDSLDMMNLLLAIEEKYGIKVPDEEAARLDSVDSIVVYLQRL